MQDDLKQRFRTIWELDPATLVDLAATRGPFVDQSQSLTLYLTDTSFESVVSDSAAIIRYDHLCCIFQARLHIRAWQKGLKTAVYYTRTRSITTALPFGLARPPPQVTSTGGVGKRVDTSGVQVLGSDESIRADVECHSCAA